VEDLEVSKRCLRNWMAAADAEDNSGGARATSAEAAEPVKFFV
jgi:hypothetical protein